MKQNEAFQLRPEILLCPRVPKPMYGLAPRVVLGQKWWNQTRKAAYRSTFYHCVACGVWKHRAKGPKWLEGHEVYTVNYLKGTWTYIETVPLCAYCHAFIHMGRTEKLFKIGKITPTRYNGIIRHGQAILTASQLTPRKEYGGPFAPWNQWRLILFGKEYRPIYYEGESVWT